MSRGLGSTDASLRYIALGEFTSAELYHVLRGLSSADVSCVT